ncbi:probable transcriptional regulatory protein Pmob_0807 [Ylistrum balloti]|uniref:probable transcriptional regulatory protein Pmob_0807 n=1 Tax=Ylistrum balloti TaxID=509963 RepID=UPI002905BA9F|nr:probable transcriptional regulatory protein Pmob_0807 [Ylistrum balloti]XP_060062650.1 probable transcriptional regulatory protein Pmob_0807 [Ylistrum balloti]
MYKVVGRHSCLCSRQMRDFMQSKYLFFHNLLTSPSRLCIINKEKTVNNIGGINTGLYGQLPCLYTVERIHTTVICTAGHNRWSNIKHIKGRTDHKRSTLYSSHIRIITGVAHSTKEMDPKFNPDLSRCLGAAKAAGVPQDVLNRLLDKLKRSDLKPYLLEVEGSDGIAVLLHCMVLNDHETLQINGPLKKKGYNVGRNVNVAYKFDHKGVITVPPIKQEEINLDDYLEIGLEAGAEDVTLETDEDEKHFIQYICSPDEMSSVVSKMKKLGLSGMQCQKVYSPIYPVMVNQETAEKIHSVFDQMMARFDFIQDVTFNFEVSDENE